MEDCILSRKRKGPLAPHGHSWPLENEVEHVGSTGDECEHTHNVPLHVGMEGNFVNFEEFPPSEAINKFWPFLRSFCNSISNEGPTLEELNGAKGELEEILLNIPQVEAALQREGAEDFFSLEGMFGREKMKFKTRKEALDNLLVKMESSLDQITNIEKEIAHCKRTFMAILSRKQLERRIVAELENTYQHRLNAITVIKTFKQHQEEEVLCEEIHSNVQSAARDNLSQKHRELTQILDLIPPVHEEEERWVGMEGGEIRPTKRRRTDRDDLLPPGLVGTTKRDRKKLSDKMLEKIYGFILKPAPLTPRSTVPITNLNTLHNFEKSLENLSIFPPTYSIMRGRKSALVNQFEFMNGYEKVNFRFRAFLQSDKKQKVEVLPLLIPHDPCEFPARCPRAREIKEALKISEETLVDLVQAWRKAVGSFETILEAKFSQNSQQLGWVKAHNPAIRQLTPILPPQMQMENHPPVGPLV